MNVLFACLLVIVVGVARRAVAERQAAASAATIWFWFGHQGYEYIDLGRVWQIFLFVGLLLWLRSWCARSWPALRRQRRGAPARSCSSSIASAAIALFYGAGPHVRASTRNLAMVEYWRWWVVHLWVEGFFEVFATVGDRLPLRAAWALLRRARSRRSVTLRHHHLPRPAASSARCTTSTSPARPTVGARARRRRSPRSRSCRSRWSASRPGRTCASPSARPGCRRYRWPIYFFVAVAFWNLVGAGLFGFLINPPIALYYMQGLNTTPVHGHAALFGVYGMLGIGLMLFCLRALRPAAAWREGALRFAFWALNGGLVLMVVLSLLPIGVLQTMASIEHGSWYARSAEFLQTPAMATLRWLRGPGDLLFGAGVVALVWFIVGLKTGWSIAPRDSRSAASDEPGDEAPSTAPKAI